MTVSMNKCWHYVCEMGEIDEEDVIQFEYNNEIYAVYHTEKGFFATDGLCTHEDQALADGLVMGTIIECPLHQGRFDITTGEAKSPPVCVNLQTYAVRVEGDSVLIKI